ncbi:ABC transporter substrate-binding protein [Bradyrhizobium glycinis]|uniref:ABC transporter substrate-binding protein n=1 Tax=Bradyrhizobium glycinis TaxID=2751812 RepID=UPI0018D9308C|nr:ABC transporter substrate-binding protein [Bradyrhizobium glycinis]MBH5369009.1 ABC transporter substrate-binding protein [Bradyrhizobium glycinis]
MQTARRKGHTARFIFGVLAGCSFACALATFVLAWPRHSQSRGAELRPAAQYTLKLNRDISPATAGTIIAESDGLFTRAGLEVHVVAGSGDADAFAAVAADEHTIGIASAAAFLKARSEGLAIVAFAGCYAASPVEFFALPDTKLLLPSDLEGKRIGYMRGPELSAVLYEFVSKNSLAQSKLLPIESDDPLQDLLNRKIDVLLGNLDVEGQELARRNIEYKTLSPASYGVHAAAAVYFVQEQALGNRRSLEKLIIATAQGWNAAYADYDRTIPIIANSIDPPLSRPLIARLMDAQRGYLRPYAARFGELDERRIRSLQSQLLRRRVLQRPVDLNLAVNYDILKEAYRSGAKNLTRDEP